jgi:hypothetical protein
MAGMSEPGTGIGWADEVHGAGDSAVERLSSSSAEAFENALEFAPALLDGIDFRAQPRLVWVKAPSDARHTSHGAGIEFTRGA